MKRMNCLAAAITVALVGCGGSDDSSSHTIDDAFIQESVTATQGMTRALLSKYFSNMFEYGTDGTIYPISTDGSYCGGGACLDGQNMSNEEYDAAWAALSALNIQEGKTLRYRTESEVNGVSLREPVSDDGYSRLVTVFINDNEHLTPARRALILDAVETIETQVGVKIFNDEILDVNLAQFDADFYLNEERKLKDSIESGGERYETAKQYRNLWKGHTYNSDASRNYDADTATHTDLDHPQYGNVIETDSYEDISEHYGVRGAITISYGTTHALLDSSQCSNYKANHSTFPFYGGDTGFKVDDKAYFTNSNWHMVNLGSHNSICKNMDTITKDIIIHELGHALGLGAHFNGFGMDGIWDERAIAVLKAIYHNPIATPISELTVVE
ncbi:hypothetical protein L2737_10200 [Shewanella electrodiphila]|uniref:Peptidase M10 metallopeptidase domain-containing protein n=1 Tax=Shewanella electrodiphila TaxID=934143 RepID=A0ABT0KQP0_9GAMM|nr:hypothetical protein [Shewanella electrodiphila]MCL1045695.1 hypothetical protein [Shewanella electrodiphila]